MARTPERRALCVGINDYPGSSSDLAGCVNDANDWAAELGRRGYSVTRLLDAQATKDAILKHLTDLVCKAGHGDRVVFTFSGHGTWVPDENKDEPDGRDEALCPHDYMAGVITDDELHALLTDRERAVRVVFVSDSCHSGTVARFASPTSLGPLAKGAEPPRVRFLPPDQVVQTREARDAVARLATLPPGKRPPRPTALLISGCQDWEYSYDAYIQGRPQGAFSHVALAALRALPAGGTYQQWHAMIRASLPNRFYPQTPNLAGLKYQREWKALE
jgi:hypothetical protein